MAVPCSGCGREYDVTLFEFGRTIWCTCGSRVGIVPRVRPASGSAARAGEAERFIADAMLGRLARWLRLLGFDCAHDAAISDETLVRRGVGEGRTILTRDRAIPEEWWVSEIVVVESRKVRGQLVEVLRRPRVIDSIRLFTRCAECNRSLEAAPRESVRAQVPATVFREHEHFRRCPGCERVYWKGSHTGRFERFVDQVIEEASTSGSELDS